MMARLLSGWKFESMKQLLFILLSIAALTACQKSEQSNQSDRYPWQVTIMPDGSNRIFGIHLGTTRIGDAREMLGKSPKLAMFEQNDGKLSLELFYKEFTRAGLTGRLVISTKQDTQQLQSLRKRAHKREKLESGVTRYYFERSLLAEIDNLIVISMTYIPYANLDEEIIKARFGEPAEKIRTHEKAQHWLYPEWGLDLILNESGKEVLQYVSPANFKQLVKPLRP